MEKTNTINCIFEPKVFTTNVVIQKKIEFDPRAQNTFIVADRLLCPKLKDCLSPIFFMGGMDKNRKRK